MMRKTIEKAVDSAMKDSTTITAYAMKLNSATNTLLDIVSHIIRQKSTNNTTSIEQQVQADSTSIELKSSTSTSSMLKQLIEIDE